MNINYVVIVMCAILTYLINDRGLCLNNSEEPRFFKKVFNSGKYPWKYTLTCHFYDLYAWVMSWILNGSVRGRTSF